MSSAANLDTNTLGVPPPATEDDAAQLRHIRRRASITLACSECCNGARDHDELRLFLDMFLLAVEEHRQGRPYLADPDHCERCAEVDHAWAEATCEHEDYFDVTGLSSPRLQLICQRCGHFWEVER